LLYHKSNSKITIKDIANQFMAKQKNVGLIENIIAEPLLPNEVKEKFLKFL
jgi:hypothetical protein